MTSVQFAQGVKNSGLELEALIANSCLQGSIETVAEWEGIGKYILFSSLRIPDISYDYTVLVEELHNDLPVEEALARTAKRTMDLWSMGYEAGLYATSVEVMRLTELQALWDAVSDAFEELRTSVNGVTFTVDPPAEFGQHFGTAYYKAYKYCLSTYAEDLYNLTAEQYVTDLQHFLKYAFSFSANLALTPYIHKLEDVLSEVVIAHYQADGKNNYRLNIYSPNDCVKGMSEYKKCRFDKLTSWSSVLEEMVKWKNTENNE